MANLLIRSTTKRTRTDRPTEWIETNWLRSDWNSACVWGQTRYQLIVRLRQTWPMILPFSLFFVCQTHETNDTRLWPHNKGILTYKRYTQREFKHKFPALWKSNDCKYTEKSKKSFQNNIAAGCNISYCVCRTSSLFMNYCQRRKRPHEWNIE